MSKPSSLSPIQGLHMDAIGVEEVEHCTPALVRELVEIDRQTFSEPTFSNYTATVLVRTGRIFVMRHRTKLIGSCVCTRVWKNRNEAHILAMGLRPGYRGQGLGQRFMSEVIDRLQAQDVHSVTLLVGSANRRAIQVYVTLGFEVVDKSVYDERTGETAVLVRLQLPKPDPAPSAP